MGLLPDINDDGSLGAAPKFEERFRPKILHPIRDGVETELNNDRFGQKVKFLDPDAPRLSDMHECEADWNDRCVFCKKKMPEIL